VSKLRVIFVAGLDPVAKGGAGGQLTQAKTLLSSGLRDAVELLPLSSTMASVPPPPLTHRLGAASTRAGRFAAMLERADAAFIYSAGGLSLFEKGFMCCMARACGHGVVVRFGAGALPGQCERHPLVQHWLRATLAAAHVVSVQGPSWVRYFERYPEAAGKLVSVPNGIVIPARERQDRCRGNHIAFVGWAQREKGVFEAIEVVRRIRERHRDVTFTIAGGGRDWAELRTYAAEQRLGHCVQMPGWLSREQVDALLANTDVLLFPSHYEGLPNVVLEAMAAAVPVVCTRVGAIPDLITEGETGMLAEVGEVDRMVTAVSHLLSHPDEAARIGANGRRVVAERYDIARVWPLHHQTIVRAAAARSIGWRSDTGGGCSGQPSIRMKPPKVETA
jgi:glycosyltransferase involved in cell wall biosynthesis